MGLLDKALVDRWDAIQMSPHRDGTGMLSLGKGLLVVDEASQLQPFFFLRGELPILCKDMRNYCTAVCRKFGTADDFSFEGFVVGVELGCTNVSHHVANFDGLIYCAPT